jgi:hypothetical protein
MDDDHVHEIPTTYKKGADYKDDNYVYEKPTYTKGAAYMDDDHVHYYDDDMHFYEADGSKKTNHDEHKYMDDDHVYYHNDDHYYHYPIKICPPEEPPAKGKGIVVEAKGKGQTVVVAAKGKGYVLAPVGPPVYYYPLHKGKGHMSSKSKKMKSKSLTAIGWLQCMTSIE